MSRELTRNSDARNGEYKADLAQKKYQTRQAQKPKPHSFTADIQAKIEAGLSEDLSPEQIVGLCKKKGEQMVSVEGIYQFVWTDKKKGGKWHTHLRSKGKVYRKRGLLKDTKRSNLRKSRHRKSS